jgi:hypothetical protein
VSAALTTLLQENRKENPYLHKELYKNLHLVYGKWDAYNRDNHVEKKKAPIFSIAQGTAMLELPTISIRTLLDKAVTVLSWYGAERMEDIYSHLSKNVKKIPYDSILNHYRK